MNAKSKRSPVLEEKRHKDGELPPKLALFRKRNY